LPLGGRCFLIVVVIVVSLIVLIWPIVGDSLRVDFNDLGMATTRCNAARQQH
jgi:hypothetical protein